MTVYERARRHTWLMLSLVLAGLVVIVTTDALFGHSTIAFAAVIFVMIVANVRMLSFDCPRCGSNLFFRGVWVVPWPNRTCDRCGLDLAANP